MSETQKNQKTAIIIGASPTGLTAAYELLDKYQYTTCYL